MTNGGGYAEWEASTEQDVIRNGEMVSKVPRNRRWGNEKFANICQIDGYSNPE